MKRKMPFRGGWGRYLVFIAFSLVIVSIAVIIRVSYRIGDQDELEHKLRFLDRDHGIARNGLINIYNENKNELQSISKSYCLFPNVQQNIAVYLLALQHSVSIIALPPSLSSNIVKRLT